MTPVNPEERVTFAPKATRTVLCIALIAGLSGCLKIAQQGPGVADAIIVDRESLISGRRNAAKPPIQQPGTYRVKPGDSLFVYVFDNPELTQTIVVGPDGRINYPLVGTIKAQGLTLGVIDKLLTDRLARNILQPEVTVTLAEIAAEQLFVTGEVVSPGVFDIKKPVSLVQAISMAGGFTAFADRSNVIVYNPARTVSPRRVFNYDAFLADPAGYDFALHPGDTVIVQ